MKVSCASRITLAATALLAGTVFAQVKVGITVSIAGPAASLDIPEKNIVTLLPKEIADKKIGYIVLDDVSSTIVAVEDTCKLITEDKVDLVIGSTVTPGSLAMADAMAENETPMITLAALARITEPMDAKRAWVFKTPQNDSHMAIAIAEHMANYGVKTVALIGFVDAYGGSWVQESNKVVGLCKLKIATNEHFARIGMSVTRQVPKITSANPDAAPIAGSDTSAALPERALKERGYKDKLYRTHGVANADLLRVHGKDCEGMYLLVGSILAAE